VISVKQEIFEALIQNQALLLLTGREGIRSGVLRDWTILPAITFFEVANSDAAFSDDHTFASEIIIQIDIWNKESTTVIAQEVDRTMKKLSFQRISATDLLEEDSGIFHKAMRYLTVRFEKGEDL
jgi:hypothetical protein